MGTLPVGHWKVRPGMSEQRIAEIRAAGHGCTTAARQTCVQRSPADAESWCEGCCAKFLLSVIDALSASPAETGLDRSQLFMDLGAFLHHRKGCEALAEMPGACGCGLLAVSNQLLAALYGLKVPSVDEIKFPAETGRASETSGDVAIFQPNCQTCEMLRRQLRNHYHPIPPSASSATTTEQT